MRSIAYLCLSLLLLCGDNDGNNDGENDGDNDGNKEGDNDGDNDGNKEGDNDGENDGDNEVVFEPRGGFLEQSVPDRHCALSFPL